MKLLNFGSCNVDYVYTVGHIVAPGETEGARGLQIFAGGKGLNQSIAAARAGVEIYHAGCIGEGGEFLSKMLEENGVDTRYLRRADTQNGHAIIQVSDSGENSIIIYPGANGEVSREMIDGVLADFGKGDMLMLQNEISNVGYLIERAAEIGMRIVLNPSPISDELTAIDFGKLEYIILNEGEAEKISGCKQPKEALARISQSYQSLKTVLTLGADGCIYKDCENEIYQPIFEANVKDTTAAGDTFTGYFVAGIIGGECISGALRRASCAAAIAVSRDGAAPSIPTSDEAKELIKTMKEKK